MLECACAILLLCACSIARADAGRPGEIQFSDGEVITGTIYLSRDMQFRLHDGEQLRTVELARVREIRNFPEKEKMERNWRFLEAGQTKKEFSGDPYPSRLLRSVLVLKDESTVSGHLYTTVLYIESEEGARKVVLLAKQRGKQRETFTDVVYPARIAFEDPEGVSETGMRIFLAAQDANKAQVVGMTRGGLVRLPGQAAKDEAGGYMLPSALGADTFAAVQIGGSIIVGWPAEIQPEPLAKVTDAMVHVRDFFDDRRLLGVYAVDEETIYSLLLLARAGKTTLGGTRTQPWRLAVWRWKQNEEGRIMVAGRSYFYRGIIASGGILPEIRMSDGLWNAALEDGVTLDVTDGAAKPAVRE